MGWSWGREWQTRCVAYGAALAVAAALGPFLYAGQATGRAASSAGAAAATESFPLRLTDQQFWALSENLSEPPGFFRSENLVSNEHTFQYVIPALLKRVKPGGIYLGVAPDQNFTYIAALRPRMAFIVDIRRGNLLEHLMYKAIIELSPDRAAFLSRLFSKKRPARLGPSSTVTELFDAFDEVPTSKELYAENVAALRTQLLTRHGFRLSPEDWDQLESIYFAFFWDGPGIRYAMAPRGVVRGFNSFPTYEELMMQTDWLGTPRSYLASEGLYRVVKDLEEKNLIVPVVGNFAGPKALRAVGRYVRERGGTITAFYVSNVEQYLFQDDVFDRFARNVATLPVDATSTFIRSVSARFGYAGGYLGPDSRASGLDPMQAFVRDFQDGQITGYIDVNVRSR